MSLVTQAMVVDRYGLRLNADQIAAVLGISKPALYNQISTDSLKMKTYLEGGKRWADYRHVAEHIDALHATAA